MKLSFETGSETFSLKQTYVASVKAMDPHESIELAAAYLGIDGGLAIEKGIGIHLP